ncbi:MAG: transporter substrate-binding domain-containing protein [Planctomycetes bacterium]|nr:transporter substrate-binding domain-containing protein [Planctomycetota bacterium]
MVNSGQVKQVTTITVSGATNSATYTITVNGVDVQYTADSSTSTTEIAAGLAAAVPASAETLRVGTECTYFPFNYREADGTLKGYDVDVANEVGQRIGAEIEFVCQEWDGMIPALLANKFDLIVASMSITDSRKEKIDFSAPYRISVGRFVGRKDRGFDLFDADGKAKPAAFQGLKVGVERASTYDNWIQAKLPGADVVHYDGNERLFLDLESGRVDLIMTNPMKAYLSYLSKDDGKGFEFVSPALAEEEFFGIGVGIGLRKDNPELLGRLNDAIKTLIENGSLDRYSHKYFPFAIHPEKWGGLPQ